MLFSIGSGRHFTYSIYIWNDANTAKEYVDSLFLAISATLIFISFTSIVLKTTEMYMFFDNAGKAADKSELITIITTFKVNEIYSTIQSKIKLGLGNRPDLKQFYEKTNPQVELLSEIIYFVMVILGLPAFLLPLAILSYYRYFFTAFMLIVPIW